ncbi:CoA transferase [Natronomonas gomsonensis]|uniref:CaiB/BaiF CoA transferase family protein n=1 Tax=Natronomonas gomsonensis TaxID=1046043 RepID=UPI0020CA3F07|nr:CoA transferase [Natronomonas gomsonensis]MCY4729936.1 CoA transferase [Natronomonas gomsonensis]
MSQDASAGPLAGLDVVDMTQMLAGPFATMLLADLGANVVKVEPPQGDMTRSNPPHLKDDEAYGGYFQSVNRNKRSLVLNLKDDTDREAFEGLVAEADVLVENYRTGTMERLGLPYEDLSEDNPGLVYASIRGFGDPRTSESPYAERPAFDLIAQAMGGIMSITGTPESGPVKVGPGIGDIFPAVLSVVGILSAIQHRERTGEGQYVDVSMVDGILSLTERIVHQYSYTDEVPEPQGNTHPLLFPFDRFEAEDGYVVIAAPNAKQWHALCEHMDCPDLAERYPTEDEQRAHADELRAVVNEWTSSYTKGELFELLADDVPCAPVQTVADIFESPHFDARDMLETVNHAETGEEVTIAGTPIKFTECDTGVRHRAPLLGEHTEEILRERDLLGETERKNI